MEELNLEITDVQVSEMSEDIAGETEDKNTEDIIAELEEKIKSMKADKEAKLAAAKTQLIDKLAVTADQYRTATGTAEALRMLRFTAGNEKTPMIATATCLAYEMVNEVLAMATRANELDYSEMDKLCEGFYEEDFKQKTEEWVDFEDSIYDLAMEMMRLDLCRNVGGAAEDMVAFANRVDEEIKATEEKLEELRKEN